MRRALLLLTLVLLLVPSYAQQRRKATARQSVATAKKTTKRKVNASRGKAAKKKIASAKSAVGGTTQIKNLEQERKRVQQQIREHERRLKNNERDVKNRLNNLLVINHEIEGKRKTIDTIRHALSELDMRLLLIDHQLRVLNAQLADCKRRYIQSMRYMHRNRSVQNKLMFIFSADNFTQMYRRMRFMREYATYQRAQGEELKTKQAEIKQKHNELSEAKRQQARLLSKGEQERRNLETKQAEQQTVVASLQKQQKTIQSLIEKQRQRDAALNAQIDRLIAEEVERAKARAAAEAKRKAEAEAARKRAAELARKKAAAEAAARENARRIAEAKAREERLKAEAAAAKSRKERAAAEAAARKAEAERREAERRAATEARERDREVAEAKKEHEEAMTMSSDDRRITGNFESNRGRLPMPVAGPYRIVSRFGEYNVEGLNNVRLDNKGINIQTQPGAQVRSVFDGEVTRVFSFGGTAVVMVRHGNYISVYCNLGSISVHQGQQVSTRQPLGTVGADHILQFQLRREKAKLNPETWLGR